MATNPVVCLQGRVRVRVRAHARVRARDRPEGGNTHTHTSATFVVRRLEFLSNMFESDRQVNAIRQESGQ